MSFAHPLILWGLAAAVAVPVLIHLLNRRRHDRVRWAAMRFVRVAEQQNRRRLRVEDLLLLLIRVALLSLLAVALARPTAARFAAAALTGRRAVTAVVVLDRSYSMTGTDGVTSRLATAKRAAAAVVDALPPGSSVAVLLASDVVDRVIPQPTRDLPLARKLIDDATVVDRPTDLLPAVRAAEEVLHPARGPTAVYVVTDGQRSGWSRPDDLATLLRAPDAAPCHLLLVGPPVRRNAAVVDLRRGGDLCPTNHPARFQVTVANRGGVALTDLPVRLRLDDDPAVAAAATIDRLAPGESRAVSLYATPTAAGPHTVTAAVPADDLPADDARSVAFRAVDHVDVLLVGGDESRPNQPSIPPATAFLRGALQPVPPDKRPTYVVRVTTADDLAGQPLDRFAAVFLADPSAVTAEADNRLAAFVKAGGGLVVFPGDRTTPDTFAADLQHLLPATIGAARGDAAKQDAFTTFAADRFDHPIVAAWADPANGSPTAAHFFRTFDLSPDPATTDDAGPPRTVVNFADGRPAAVERPFGRGRSILFAFPADTAWSDLPDHGGLFVPLVYRCLAAAVDRADESLTVAVGRPLIAAVPITAVGRPATVTPPAGEKSSVVVVDQTATVRYDHTDRAGPYAVSVGDTRLRFAAVADPAESVSDPLTPADRAALSAVATVTDWSPATPVADLVTDAGPVGRRGDDLWLVLAAAALGLAVAEPLLANRWSRPR